VAGLHPAPRWESLQRSLRPCSWILRGQLRGGRKREGKGGNRMERLGRHGRKGRYRGR